MRRDRANKLQLRGRRLMEAEEWAEAVGVLFRAARFYPLVGVLTDCFEALFQLDR